MTGCVKGLVLGLAVGAAGLGGCSKGTAPPRRGIDAGPGGGSAAARDGVGFRVGKAGGEWRAFTPPGEPITVQLPGVPLDNHWTPYAKDGVEVHETTWALEREDQSVAFTLTVVHFPPGFVPQGAPLDELLKKESLHCFNFAREELADLAQHPLDLDGTPGLSAVAVWRKGTGALVMQQRILKRGDATYCAVASLRTDAPASAKADAERFLLSIQLAPVPTPPPADGG